MCEVMTACSRAVNQGGQGPGVLVCVLKDNKDQGQSQGHQCVVDVQTDHLRTTKLTKTKEMPATTINPLSRNVAIWVQL